MNQDSEHLKILAIFHYVVAGIAGMFACFPIFHLAVGISMLTGGFFATGVSAEEAFPMTLFGLLFTVLPAAMIVLGWAFAISLGVAGYFLSQRRRYLYCLVVAGISCIFMPFGTVLGVFTILVLMRPSVKEMFGVESVSSQA